MPFSTQISLSSSTGSSSVHTLSEDEKRAETSAPLPQLKWVRLSDGAPSAERFTRITANFSQWLLNQEGMARPSQLLDSDLFVPIGSVDEQNLGALFNSHTTVKDLVCYGAEPAAFKGFTLLLKLSAVSQHAGLQDNIQVSWAAWLVENQAVDLTAADSVEQVLSVSERLQLLGSAGCNLNEALHVTLKNKDVEIASTLADLGANLAVTDRRGNNALHVLLWNHYHRGSDPQLLNKVADLVKKEPMLLILSNLDKITGPDFAKFHGFDFLHTLESYLKHPDRLEDYPSQCVLALMYQRGLGGTTDAKLALSMLTHIANQSQHAAYLAGFSHLEGLGCVPSVNKAVEFFQLAASKGSAFAHMWIGFLHLGNRGFPTNLNEAQRCLSKAARLGNTEAYLLETRLLASQAPLAPEKMVSRNLWPAMQGNTDSQFFLGSMFAIDAVALRKAHASEEAVKLSAEKAVYWLNLACASGHAKSHLAMAKSYENGLFTEKNLKFALMRYRLVAKHATEIEQDLVKQVEPKLTQLVSALTPDLVEALLNPAQKIYMGKTDTIEQLLS